jgi:hypothetical protein
MHYSLMWEIDLFIVFNATFSNWEIEATPF